MVDGSDGFAPMNFALDRAAFEVGLASRPGTARSVSNEAMIRGASTTMRAIKRYPKAGGLTSFTEKRGRLITCHISRPHYVANRRELCCLQFFSSQPGGCSHQLLSSESQHETSLPSEPYTANSSSFVTMSGSTLSGM